MPASIPMLGNATYNGHDFTPFARTRMRRERVANDSGQQTKQHRIIFQISDYVSVETGTTDGDFDTLKRKLLKERQAFTYTGRGAGNHTINVSAMNDVEMGPKPRVVSWNPVGASMALQFVWEVEMNVIPDCEDGNAITSGPKAWEVTKECEIDKYLMTTVTYSGYIEIIQNTISTSSLRKADAADAYRHLLLTKLGISCPQGFAPSRATFKQSADGSRLDFTVSYREMYDPYPAGIIEGRGSIKMRNANETNTSQWWVTVQATFVAADPEQKVLAFNAFMTILGNKVAALLNPNAVYNFNSNPYGRIFDSGLVANLFGYGSSSSSYSRATGGFVKIGSMEIESGFMDDKEQKFSVSILVANTLDQIIQKAGIFKPITALTRSDAAAAWIDSDSSGVISSMRGVAGFQLGESAVLVNLCNNSEGSSGYPSTRGADYAQWNSESGGSGTVDNGTAVVAYKCDVVQRNSPAIVPCYPTGSVPTSQSGGSASSGSASSSASGPYIQKIGQDIGVTILRGVALTFNAYFPIPIPYSVDDQPVTPLPMRVSRRVEGDIGNGILLRTEWEVPVLLMAPAPKGVVKDQNGINPVNHNPQNPKTTQRPAGVASNGGGWGSRGFGDGGFGIAGTDSIDERYLQNGGDVPGGAPGVDTGRALDDPGIIPVPFIQAQRPSGQSLFPKDFGLF